MRRIVVVEHLSLDGVMQSPSGPDDPFTGDAGAAVAELKAKPGRDLAVLGSGDLVQTLMRHNLVDRYQLMIHPVVLGTGRRLFPDGGVPADLRLTDSVSTTTGVVIATYEGVNHD